MVVDTSIFIEYLRTKDKSKTILASTPNNTKLFTTSVSVYELMVGATSVDKAEHFRRLLIDVEILPFEIEAAKKAAEIYNQLKKINQLIEFRDIFIAAICITNSLPILTLNKKHFTRIDDLLLV